MRRRPAPAPAATSTAFPAASVGATALAAAGDTPAFAAADSNGVAALFAHFAAGEAADGRFDPHRAFAGSTATSGALTGISSVAGLFARATATKEVKDDGFEPHRVLEPASSGTAIATPRVPSPPPPPPQQHQQLDVPNQRHLNVTPGVTTAGIFGKPTAPAHPPAGVVTGTPFKATELRETSAGPTLLMQSISAMPEYNIWSFELDATRLPPNLWSDINFAHNADILFYLPWAGNLDVFEISRNLPTGSFWFLGITERGNYNK
ncbi:hypothetical protein HK405_004793, partial [Cladochytrium tenue]